MAFNDNAVFKVHTLDGDVFEVTIDRVMSWDVPKEKIDIDTAHEMGLCCNLNVGQWRTDEDGDVWERIA